jgi:hypothetical protein
LDIEETRRRLHWVSKDENSSIELILKIKNQNASHPGFFISE